ncbi:ankyrin repeat domain-containing protein SOWAHA-like, partial [Penaeus japonicus]|uniref:ankyrin repeat domain-containing protein SOWAHA-like n=1 Tax=Penaeus japonicus TaxID=27405 RepID=UPI001C7137E6
PRPEFIQRVLLATRISVWNIIAECHVLRAYIYAFSASQLLHGLRDRGTRPYGWMLVLWDDHGFSLLHWAAKEGHLGIVEMLITRGARINATNLGDDIPIHLAAAHGHRDVVSL